MATYKLIPSSWSGTVASPSNAYNDTTNTTYATVASGAAYLGGFDFSVMPQGHAITSITVKFKGKGNTSNRGRLYSGVDGVPLSEYQSLTSTETVYELQLSEPLDTILGYLSTLCIKFEGILSSCYVYGAEINVEAVKPRNKIIYGNETLIDLTSDTVTAADVISGVVFHLPRGTQAIGTLVTSVNKKTATSSSSTATSLAFTNLTKEPSFFVALPNSSVDRSFSGGRAICFLYDGETTYKIYCGYSSGATKADIKATSASFTYSSGTLTVRSSGSIYILQGGWNLFYI